jgi:hypothetical protein
MIEPSKIDHRYCFVGRYLFADPLEKMRMARLRRD